MEKGVQISLVKILESEETEKGLKVCQSKPCSVGSDANEEDGDGTRFSH